MFRSSVASSIKIYASLLVMLFVLAWPLAAYAEGEQTEAEYEWIEGSGQTVDIGTIGQIALDPSLVYLDAENTRSYLDNNGNISSERDVGSVFSPEEGWVVYFEYFDDGHVADDEKNEIDADALLESYKEGTEAQNEKLDDPLNHLFVEGWEEAPRYDETKRALTWTLRMHDGGDQPLVNQNIRVLTREGNMSLILVTDPAHLSDDSAKMKEVVYDRFAVVEGQRYEDFDASTDKKANYGLTGLILGGAGLVVAKKVGLLAAGLLLAKKFGVFVIAGGAWLWNKLRKRPKRKDPEALDEVAATSEQ